MREEVGSHKLSRMQEVGRNGRSRKRPRRGRAEWLEEVRRWRESGESAEAYAKKHDLHAGTLAGWSSKLKTRRRQQAGTAFVPVRVVERPAMAPVKVETSEIEVVLLNGRRVRISGNFESDTVARILAVVEGGDRC